MGPPPPQEGSREEPPTPTPPNQVTMAGALKGPGPLSQEKRKSPRKDGECGGQGDMAPLPVAPGCSLSPPPLKLPSCP